MRRKQHHRLLTLLLMLLLFGGGTLSAPRSVRAGFTPGDPSSPVPGDPQAGDPDMPTQGGRSPKPTPGLGLRQPTGDTLSVRKGRMSTWWSVRVALSAVYRIFFRI